MNNINSEIGKTICALIGRYYATGAIKIPKNIDFTLHFTSIEIEKRILFGVSLSYNDEFEEEVTEEELLSCEHIVDDILKNICK